MILLEFDDGSSNKSYLIRFSYDSLRPLIKVKRKNGGQELYNCKDLVEKAIKTEAKASLLLSFILRKMDQQVTRSKQPTKGTKFSPQGPPMRDPRTKDFKPRNQNSKLADSQPSKFINNKACKESKKDQRN